MSLNCKHNYINYEAKTLQNGSLCVAHGEDALVELHCRQRLEFSDESIDEERTIYAAVYKHLQRNSSHRCRCRATHLSRRGSFSASGIKIRELSCSRIWIKYSMTRPYSSGRHPTPSDELSKISFPLHTLDILAMIGGSTFKEMSKRMLIYVFTNELASLYSWVRGKGKNKLHHLEVMKLMYKVVRKTFSNVTEKNFETKCKDWFQHAKLRFENEKRREDNFNK
ncbi:hypothetical protein PUN28_013929 [Cardiocondyla obscurior]|uniref:Uncharacterized protein n=1 Tax=Cardiocondyla obscurior TaxID=286306 RepID=A0AAW2F6G6_9HYME